MSEANRKHVLMLLENCTYPRDGRVRREARSLMQAGYDVTVICPRDAGQPLVEIMDGVRVYRFPSPPKANGLFGYLWEYGYSMAAMFVLTWYVYLRRGFDVIHAHNPPDTPVLIAAIFKLLGKRYIFDHHDLSPEMYHARFGGRGNKLVHRALVLFEWLSCRLADRVIATNQSYKAIEIKRAGIPESRITVVRNGPDLRRLRPVPFEAELRCDGKTVLCYVGEMGFQDGVEYLLYAVRHLVQTLQRRDFRCLLVGGGDAWSHLVSLAEQLELGSYISFTGPVPFDRVACYLSAADICVAPEPSNSYNDRSTMVKVMEYMALAKPIVAFDLPEHRYSAGEAAIYARPNEPCCFAECILTLMDDPQRCKRMGDFGRKRVLSELAWFHQSKNLIEAYEKLLSNGTTTQPVAPAPSDDVPEEGLRDPAKVVVQSSASPQR